jgi:uncharacterized protein involved in response to NO
VSTPASHATALWRRGFRPFFLLAGGYAVAGVAMWIAVLAGWLAAPAWLVPTWWHGHEMVFGFVGAAMAGFLLTSVPVWTGAEPWAGASLAALAGLWLAGRLAMAWAGHLPTWLVASVDGAFLPALALVIARPIRAAGQLRNAVFPLLVGALALANLAMHLGALGAGERVARTALYVGVDLVTLLVVVLTGRLTPLFTDNALRRAGIAAPLRPHAGLERAAQLGVGVLAVADALSPGSRVSGVAALAAAAAAAGRMVGWHSLRVRSDPLLWSLHAGAAWVVGGLAALALADLLGVPPRSTALHALTAGAFGATILAVMTRVALGHTGRPFATPPGIAWAYALVSGGALLRVVGPLAFPRHWLAVMATSGALWAAAFAIFLAVYAPILVRPRVDGRDG